MFPLFFGYPLSIGHDASKLRAIRYLNEFRDDCDIFDFGIAFHKYIF